MSNISRCMRNECWGCQTYEAYKLISYLKNDMGLVRRGNRTNHVLLPSQWEHALPGNQVWAQGDALPMSGLKISSTTSWKNSLETPPSSTPCSPSNSTYNCFFKSAGFSIAIISSWGVKGKGGDCGVRDRNAHIREAHTRAGEGGASGGRKKPVRADLVTDGRWGRKSLQRWGRVRPTDQRKQHPADTQTSWSLCGRPLGYGLGQRSPQTQNDANQIISAETVEHRRLTSKLFTI